jgi:hypothetical protein
MSQGTAIPPWLPELLRGWGSIEATLGEMAARHDRADRRQERIEGQILALKEAIAALTATMTATLSQGWRPGPMQERKTLTEWAVWLAGSLPWKRTAGWGLVWGAMILANVAPAGWLGDALRRLAAFLQWLASGGGG